MTEPYPSGPVAMLSDSDPFRRLVLFLFRNPMISKTLQTRVGAPDEKSIITQVFSFQISLAAQLETCIHCIGYARPFLPVALLAPRTKLILGQSKTSPVNECSALSLSAFLS